MQKGAVMSAVTSAPDVIEMTDPGAESTATDPRQSEDVLYVLKAEGVQAMGTQHCLVVVGFHPVSLATAPTFALFGAASWQQMKLTEVKISAVTHASVFQMILAERQPSHKSDLSFPPSAPRQAGRV